MRRCRAANFPIDGVEALAARARGLWPFLTEPNARRLVRAYGTRLDRILGDARAIDDLGECFGDELTAAEVRYLMRHEFAETADDVLWRRSKLGLRMGAEAEAALTRFMEASAGRAAAEWTPEVMPSHLLAIDQGTTSTRAFLFDAALAPVGFAQLEFPQIFPAPGWVEHDPQGIWTTSVATARAAMASAGVAASESRRSASPTSARPRSSGTARPASRSTTRSSGRTAAPHDACAALARAGHEKLVSERTGLLLDPYFSATKIAWLLDNVDGARAAAGAGQLAFGTVDSYLLWHFTGGKVHATDATNAARTALLDIRTGQWDDGAARSVPRSGLAAAGGARLGGRFRHDAAASARRRRCASSASRATSRRQPSGRAASSPA